MKKNMGKCDRKIRLALGVLLFFAYGMGWVSGIIGLVALLLGAIFIYTSIVSFCPLYTLFGFTTKKEEDQSSSSEIK